MPGSWSASRPRATIQIIRWRESNCSGIGKAGRSKPAAAPMPHRPSWWAISWPAAASTALGEVVPSYRPGVTPTDLATCLPDYAIAAIREALPAFGRQIKGFDMADAVLTGVETRTSSPIRIQRGRKFPEPQHAGALSGRRRRGLCRRHSFRGGGWDQSRGSGGEGDCGYLERAYRRWRVLLLYKPFSLKQPSP